MPTAWKNFPDDDLDIQQLFQTTNRGGLSAPTLYLYTVCVLGYCVYQKILQNDEMLKNFL